MNNFDKALEAAADKYQQDPELSAIFEQAYKDMPGVSRAAIHSLICRGIKYKHESHDRLQDDAINAKRLMAHGVRQLEEIEALRAKLTQLKSILATVQELGCAHKANLTGCPGCVVTLELAKLEEKEV